MISAWLALGPWAWLIAGLVLAALETLVPGVFFVWLGVAALLTGVAEWAFAPSGPVSLIIFAGFAGLSVFVGRILTRRIGDGPDDRPNLNRRGAALVGRVFPLDGPLAAGSGRIRVDDTVWRVAGPDLATGLPVRVLRVEGTVLVVEAA